MPSYPIEYDDLDETQRAALQELVRYCRRKVDDAIVEVKRAKVVPSEHVREFFGIHRVTPVDLNDLDVIAGKYKRIAGVLHGRHPLEFEGESGRRAFPWNKEESVAYVWMACIRQPGEAVTVHLMREVFFSNDRDSGARTIIHELGHAVADLRDLKKFMYRTEALSTSKALRNADTYAHFAITRPKSADLSLGGRASPRGHR